LVDKLDDLAKTATQSPGEVDIQETIQIIGRLHPGMVPDRSARLQSLRAQKAADPRFRQFFRQVEILDRYYDAAARGNRPRQPRWQIRFCKER